MVEVSLNSDGYIKQIKDNANIKNALPIAPGTALTGEDDTDVVTIAGNSYDAANAIRTSVAPTPRQLFLELDSETFLWEGF
jgi:hypothetical protein